MKKQKKRKTTFISVIILLVLMIAFFLLSYILENHEFFSQKFEVVIEWLNDFEIAISEIDNRFEIVFVLMILYIIKCWLPLPINAVCIISGMVFDIPTAFLINMTGLTVETVIKYQEGRWLGGGVAHNILKKNDTVRSALEFDGSGNPVLLFVFRLVPFFPVNTITKLYGGMKCHFGQFMLLSLVGMAPRIYGYTRIGRAAFNPFSKEFIILITIMVCLSGFSALGFNIYFDIKSRQQHHTKKRNAE